MNLGPIFIANMRNGEEFISGMDKVLRDLRSDFDVATEEHSKIKITELKKVHVDVTGSVSTLANSAPGSNGCISGLRGTGKSHLMLIARDLINYERKSFCVYINLKELFKIGDSTIVDERFYVWGILKQLQRQLISLIDDDTPETRFQKMMNLFRKKRDNDAKVELLEKVFSKIEKLIYMGDMEMLALARTVTTSSLNGTSSSSRSNVGGALGVTGPKLESVAEQINGSSSSKKHDESYNVDIFLSTSSLQQLLIEVVGVLGLESIVFFYDEWSMLEVVEQNLLSKLIRSMSTSPIYHWIGYIPYKSTLGVLEQTADMPHRIDLDLQFIYEEDNQICKEYFKRFMNNRIESVFGSNVLTVGSIVKPQFFDSLVIASMGNTRDFGVMLNKAWQFYKQDFLIKGNTRFINKKHVVSAIKAVADEKMNNLKSKNIKYSERLWNEIVKFVGEKKHTHFCIELDNSNVQYINEEEMQDLMYHRLVHLRKKDMTPKDGGEWRLSMYAVDASVLFSRIFETKSDKKKIKLVTDVNVIHNQVRRYLFEMSSVLDEFRLLQGKQIKCSCGKYITEDMKLAWEVKKCPYCATPLLIN
ncbi:hypothetical protein QW71_17045 [Paenibacillus sp. IHB B 3415]|uniref:putative metallopeptidase n=1 Tax=Paenibacillus sp. IHB B 3415 TaxID=867080 RepID=UPI000573ABF7|nr:putative metallopeptidase [Paenibacillus sp. IHB B 3415]KHL94586.1 hypothetical protein QW71_17045 [Paenibacillus sp. IHB B 3415]